MAMIGGKSYHDGALERIGEASLLLRNGHLAGSAYLAGRAVEGMLRAVVWITDRDVKTGQKSLDTGHNLLRLLAMVRDLGLLGRDEMRNELEVSVNAVARQWKNDLRFFARQRRSSGTGERSG